MDLIDRLQIAFPFSQREANLLILTAPRRYKIHTIEKRNGRGLRLIAQPTAELKLVQKWLLLNYLQKLPVHSAAVAYRSGISIKDHAEIHACNRYLLKLDFQNFFPSITADDFRQHISQFANFNLPDQMAICRLLFRADQDAQKLTLSIGAPSSPFVSNTIMFTFDTLVTEYCKKIDVLYSRYADDLAFSTNKPFILSELKNWVVNVCLNLDYPRLSLNERKTVFTSKKHQRQLTGLILSNEGRASLGRKKKREIRAMAHRFSLDSLTLEETSKLRGLMAFSSSIDEEFSITIRRMLGEKIYLNLIQGLSAKA